ELVAEQHQRRERAQARRRQRRQNGQGVDEALVEDAKDNIDRDQRGQDQERDGGQRVLERLGVALEGRCQADRNLQLLHRLLDRVGRGTERDALCEVEADGDRWELALVADREGLDRGGRPFGEGTERHHLVGDGRPDVELVESRRVAQQLRQHLLDHLVGVHLGEILRDLPLAEGVVERVVDQLRLDAVARGHVAVDLERQRRAGVLLVGGDVAQLWQ